MQNSWLHYNLRAANTCTIVLIVTLIFFFFLSPGTSIAVSSILFGLVMVGRAASIFPLSYLTNLAKKSPSDRIGFKQQVYRKWELMALTSINLLNDGKYHSVSGYNMVGWAYARCCICCTCIQ